MEKFQELRDASFQKIRLADHILTQTYPLVNDPKLLLIALENLFLALSYSMGAIVTYERLFKRIPPYQDDFNGKFETLHIHLKDKYSLDESYFRLLKEVRDILIEHKKSPMEFKRKDSFVICSETYRIKTLNMDKLKVYLKKSKDFINIANNIVSKDEHIFKRESVVLV